MFNYDPMQPTRMFIFLNVTLLHMN